MDVMGLERPDYRSCGRRLPGNLLWYELSRDWPWNVPRNSQTECQQGTGLPRARARRPRPILYLLELERAQYVVAAGKCDETEALGGLAGCLGAAIGARRYQRQDQSYISDPI